MSGWTETEEGCVKIIHHSTSSTIEIIVTEKGEFDDVQQKIFLDYYDFSDLKKAINNID